MTFPGPTPAFNNPPVHAQFFVPQTFIISDIQPVGIETLVTTAAIHDYVIGQLVRFHIPPNRGMRQLNNQLAFVTALNSTTSFTVEKDIFSYDEFLILGGDVSSITTALNAEVTTTAPHNLRSGQEIVLRDVDGMTEINDRNIFIQVTSSTTFTTGLDSTEFGAYTGGGEIEVIGQSPQVSAVGDKNNTTADLAIEGAFRNIS
jgi:hypothetical protein